VVGLLLAGSVAVGHWSSGFHLDSWLVGLVGFPAALLALQWTRARRTPEPPDRHRNSRAGRQRRRAGRAGRAVPDAAVRASAVSNQ
jgi:hypothetical protein